MVGPVVLIYNNPGKTIAEKIGFHVTRTCVPPSGLGRREFRDHVSEVAQHYLAGPDVGVWMSLTLKAEAALSDILAWYDEQPGDRGAEGNFAQEALDDIRAAQGKSSVGSSERAHG